MTAPEIAEAARRCAECGCELRNLQAPPWETVGGGLTHRYPEHCVTALRADLAAAERDVAYLRWRLDEIMPLFEEARDALPGITVTTAKLRGISLDLAARMDRAGSRTRADFDAMGNKG